MLRHCMAPFLHLVFGLSLQIKSWQWELNLAISCNKGFKCNFCPNEFYCCQPVFSFTDIWLVTGCIHYVQSVLVLGCQTVQFCIKLLELVRFDLKHKVFYLLLICIGLAFFFLVEDVKKTLLEIWLQATLADAFGFVFKLLGLLDWHQLI